MRQGRTCLKLRVVVCILEASLNDVEDDMAAIVVKKSKVLRS